MRLFEEGKIYFCANPVDWRLGLKGLSAYALYELNINFVKDGSYVIFFNKNRRFLRAIFYQGNKLMMLEARLEPMIGRFPVLKFNPDTNNYYCELTRDELEEIFSVGNSRLTYAPR